MRTKFTKGPWIADGCVICGNGTEIDVEGCMVAVATNRHSHPRFSAQVDRDECLPNAHLIAAAPELCEALDYAVTRLKAVREFLEANPIKEYTAVWDGAECDGYCLDDECDAAINASLNALAKARGEGQ